MQLPALCSHMPRKKDHGFNLSEDPQASKVGLSWFSHQCDETVNTQCGIIAYRVAPAPLPALLLLPVLILVLILVFVVVRLLIAVKVIIVNALMAVRGERAADPQVHVW
jgi:hypothetical protein